MATTSKEGLLLFQKSMTEDLLASAAEVKPVPAKIEAVNNGDQNKSSIATAAAATTTTMTTYEPRKIRKRRSFNLFKAAMLMMTRKSGNKQKNKPSKGIEIESPPPKQQQLGEESVVHSSKGDNWKTLVGSIRPLHVPDNKSPTITPSPTVENLEDLAHGGSSCSFPSPSRYEVSSNCSMSQYASATNLQELDVDNNSTIADEKEDDPDEVFDAITGDDMIDAKAELFIAQFYQQMKLQKI